MIRENSRVGAGHHPARKGDENLPDTIHKLYYESIGTLHIAESFSYFETISLLNPVA
jgi:hypothetical protein